ncbi:hypothetical protein BaRGS_00031708 [Batillaria attramentaria]|uniref:RING-type domain-containing protein n=1 Tax=Batillaria attramentaria TaxID=370345 RepID=A0ABD0JR00_9CAEN
MDSPSFSCFTPEVRRLSTFQTTPILNQPSLSISNSPAKFAQAGFLRAEGASNDDVTCEYCGITYGGWSGESPFAVHRVLNEKCPFLITPSPSNALHHHPRVVEARRRLFPADDENDEDSIQSHDDSIDDETPEPSEPPYVSVLSAQAAISHPFQPKVGDFTMLFESRRLRTFTDQGCPECVAWAEEGFVFKPDIQNVQCVFCGVVLPFDAFDPKHLHAQKSASCPRVMCIDVGNISAADEERIKLKNLQRQLRSKSSSYPYAISYPQYEEEGVRLGTFENWPVGMGMWNTELQPAAMSSAGFFYTGCADKVRCYSCGVGLLKWQHGSDPWEQHVLTEADLPVGAGTGVPESGSSPGQLVTSPPGSPTLDVAAINAALATSQYTIQQIRHAVLTFFLQTSRYPTKEILLGTLKAADENFTTVCQQREALHQKDTELQQTHTELQQKDTELQQTDTELQQKDTELQQKDTELQQTHTELQQKHTVLQQHVGQLEEKDQLIETHRQELQVKDEALQIKEEELRNHRVELDRKVQQMRYQDQQIESLRLQVQALLAERRLAGHGAAPNEESQTLTVSVEIVQAVQAANPAPVPAGDMAIMHDIRCKVCLSEESNSIFQPCLHVSCCRQCAHQLLNTPCPVCRVKISDVLPAYIS